MKFRHKKRRLISIPSVNIDNSPEPYIIKTIETEIKKSRIKLIEAKKELLINFENILYHSQKIQLFVKTLNDIQKDYMEFQIEKEKILQKILNNSFITPKNEVDALNDKH